MIDNHHPSGINLGIRRGEPWTKLGSLPVYQPSFELKEVLRGGAQLVLNSFAFPACGIPIGHGALADVLDDGAFRILASHW